MTATARPRCAGKKLNGEPCRVALGISADGLCLMHDPARRDAALASSAAGGRAKGEARRAARERRALEKPDDTPPAPKTLDDATKYFAWIAHAVTTGRLDARSGHEAAYALNGFKAAAEKRDLEREIKALRKQLDELKMLPRRVS
jgi:hypothetical protein